MVNKFGCVASDIQNTNKVSKKLNDDVVELKSQVYLLRQEIEEL